MPTGQPSSWHHADDLTFVGSAVSNLLATKSTPFLTHTVVLIRQMASITGLLSLPDELLASIAKRTHNFRERHNELKYWARAASTCKRLSEVQLCSSQPIHNWKSEASKMHPQGYPHPCTVCKL